MKAIQYHPIHFTAQQTQYAHASKRWNKLIHKINDAAAQQKASIKNGTFLWGSVSVKITNLKILRQLETAVGVLTAINVFSKEINNEADLLPSESIFELGFEYLIARLRKIREVLKIERLKAPWRVVVQAINSQRIKGKYLPARIEGSQFIWRKMVVSLHNQKVLNKLKHATDLIDAINKINSKNELIGAKTPIDLVLSFGIQGLTKIFYATYHDFKKPQEEAEITHIDLPNVGEAMFQNGQAAA